MAIDSRFPAGNNEPLGLAGRGSEGASSGTGTRNKSAVRCLRASVGSLADGGSSCLNGRRAWGKEGEHAASRKGCDRRGAGREAAEGTRGRPHRLPRAVGQRDDRITVGAAQGGRRV